MVNYKEVLKKCEDKGVCCSRMTVYRAGIKEGFIVKSEEGNQLKNDIFEKWLDKIVSGIPDNCIFICNAVKSSKIPYSYFKYYFEKNNVSVMKYYNGLMYVKKSDVDAVIAKYSGKFTGKEE